MKKSLKIYFAVIGAIVLAAVLTMAGLQIEKNNYGKKLQNAKTQVANFQKFQYTNNEFNKLKKSKTDEIYYYGADGKRYVFPTKETYSNWFSIASSDLLTYDLNKLYETPLGGNVTCRPGTLIQTPTDNNVYIVVKNGHLKSISESLLNLVYDYQWKKLIINLPNFYFTNYTVDGSISELADFPSIPPSLTIDQDKGLSQ